MKFEYVDCPVCGPSRTRIWLKEKSGARYVRCLDCDTVYASPRFPREVRHSNGDTVWDYTPELLARESLRLPALKQEADYIQRHSPGGRLLDVGCSSGDLFRFFAPSSWERYGVELSATAAEYASRTYDARVVPGTLRSAQFPDGYFDLVTMLDMLYLVDDPRAEMDEVKRILSPKGIVAIEIAGQAYMFLRSRGAVALLMERRWCRLTPDTHLYWFTPAGLQRLLENSGLRPFAWYVASSPVRPNPVSHWVASAYYRVYSSLAGRSLSMLNWAPRYLCLAGAPGAQP
ncbi:MAG: class I SAM-dependent methyltransferase [Chloroflexi bacterium]|nr:class I SAM-dependent methyltransferase [Chloroflexota bacterium]